MPANRFLLCLVCFGKRAPRLCVPTPLGSALASRMPREHQASDPGVIAGTLSSLSYHGFLAGKTLQDEPSWTPAASSMLWVSLRKC